MYLNFGPFDDINGNTYPLWVIAGIVVLILFWGGVAIYLTQRKKNLTLHKID